MVISTPLRMRSVHPGVNWEANILGFSTVHGHAAHFHVHFAIRANVNIIFHE